MRINKYLLFIYLLLTILSIGCKENNNIKVTPSVLLLKSTPTPVFTTQSLLTFTPEVKTPIPAYVFDTQLDNKIYEITDKTIEKLKNKLDAKKLEFINSLKNSLMVESELKSKSDELDRYKITEETLKILPEHLNTTKLDYIKSQIGKELNKKELYTVFTDLIHSHVITLKTIKEHIDKVIYFKDEEFKMILNECNISSIIGLIAVDSSGSLYVQNFLKNQVFKFTSDGNFVAKWKLSINDPIKENYIYVRKFLVDRKGYFYLINEYDSKIFKFTPDGKPMYKWGKSINDSFKQLTSICTINIGPDNYIYIYDPFTIYVYNSNEDFIKKIELSQEIYGNDNYYELITKDKSGNIFLAIPGKALKNGYIKLHYGPSILKFNSSGKCITYWGGRYYGKNGEISLYGTGDGQFSNIVDIDLDEKGNIYVLETYRIQKFDSNGNFITKWGKEGSGNGEFSKPIDIAVDAKGNVYVMNAGNGRIQKFKPNPKYKSNN